MSLREDAESIFRAGLARVHSRNMLKHTLKVEKDVLIVPSENIQLPLRNFKNIYVFAIGKAASAMALGLSDLIREKITRGLVITKDGHGEAFPENFRLLLSSHPVPDERSLRAGEELYRFCENATADDLVVGLISGGASALAVLPIEGVTLEEKQKRTRELLSSGAPIQEINRVRKSLSQIKGGKLARLIQPATSLNLILSDVIGDDLHVIASGLTVPESGEIPENLYNVIIGSNRLALEAARLEAIRLGYNPVIISDKLTGEARDAARLFAKASQEKSSRTCYLAGGETTVTLKGNGKGGRNQEMALAFLSEIDPPANVAFLAASTDGSDGPTDAAGAFALHGMPRNQIQDYLERNDSWNYFEKNNGLLKTGPTGTNVCDLQILLIS